MNNVWQNEYKAHPWLEPCEIDFDYNYPVQAIPI